MDLAKLIILFFALFLGGIIALTVFRTITRSKRPCDSGPMSNPHILQAELNKSALKNTLDVSDDFPPSRPAPVPVMKTDIRGVEKNNVYYNSVLGLKVDFNAEGRSWKLLTGEALHRYQMELYQAQYGPDFLERYEGLDEGMFCLAASTTDNRCNVTINASQLEEDVMAEISGEDLFAEESITAIADGLTAAGASGVNALVERRKLGDKSVRVIAARGNSPYGPVCQVAYRVLSGNRLVNMVITTYNGDDSASVLDACSPF